MRVHGSRVPSFTTHVFTGFGEGKSSADETRTEPLEEGDVVMFDFGAVVDGYCSDFGRTVCVGEPEADVREAYALVLAAQEAGRAALRPGVPASEVNRACRRADRGGRLRRRASSTAWGTGSASTSTSARSSPRRTTRRSRPA